MPMTKMAPMDLDSIVESEIGTQEVEEPVNSDAQPQHPEEPANPPAPEGPGETNGDTPSGEEPPAPETGDDEPQGGQIKRPFTRLEKAEYSATKWKRRAKNLQKERDKIAAEFERYKNLNPAAFRSPEDRMQFLAWRAQTAQRLNDMNEDLKEIERNEAEDAYDEKVSQCYSVPESAEAFRKLDDHYSQAFEYACKQVDPDGIIRDFLRDSPYEPAMRNVIYKNGDLQDELFRVYRNPQIGNARRQQILQNLEAQIEAFYRRQAQQVPAKAKPAAAAKPAAPKGPEASKPVTQPTAGRTPKYQLPARPAAAAPAAPAAAPAQEVPAPAAAPQQVVKPKPQVTGVLTRGDGAGAGEPDTSAQADALYNQIFSSGM